MQSKEDAETQCKHAIALNVKSLIEQKIAFLASLPVPAGLSEEMGKTYLKCMGVMKSQVYSPGDGFLYPWTTPDKMPHRYLWLWDSVFHSMGNKYISPKLAQDSLRAVLATQRADGMIPHITTLQGSSDITQPPVLAWGIYQLYTCTQDKSFLADVYGQLKRYLQWNIADRDDNGNSLFEWEIREDILRCRCDESGMDNSPRFDGRGKMDCVDFSSFMANEARHMALICHVLENNEDDMWETLYAKTCDAINECLWDADSGFYYDRYIESGYLSKTRAVSGFLPLRAGVCDAAHAKRLVEHLRDASSFGSPLGIPSVAASDEAYGTDMWREPVWINYNYMIAKGLKDYGEDILAQRIIDNTLKEMSKWHIREGVIFEYYDSLCQTPPNRMHRKGASTMPYNPDVKIQNIRDYGWSSALFVAMIFEILE